MIDTTGWKINVSYEQIKLILSKSKEFSEYDHATKTTRFRIIKDNIYIGSYDSNVTIRCYETNQVYIEFSLPKQYLGNNVELLYPSQLEQALAGVYESLVDRFGAFPHYKNWYLQRLDLCYGWRYQSQESAEQILKILKTFDYPRKSKYLYRESVMWRGKTSSIKFYLKNPEFTKHDYKNLYDINPEKAKEILNLSDGVLRFEITFRKQSINYIFNKSYVTSFDLLDKRFLENVLSTYLNRLTLNLDKTMLNDQEVLFRLQKHFSKRKALRVFLFYQWLTSSNIYYRQILKDHYNPSTIWRYKQEFKKAKLGISVDTVSFDFDLQIPSELSLMQI
jgi:hypothetical protein